MKRLLLAIILAASTCSAQQLFWPNLGLRLAAANPTPCVASSTSPTNIAGLAFWWVASDLVVGNKVTNWVDRIQSNNLSQATQANRPTNSAIGVRFDDSLYLVMTNYTFTTKADSWYMILNLDSANGIPDFWLVTPNTSSAATRLHYTSGGSDAKQIGFEGGGPSFNNFTPLVKCDLIYAANTSTNLFSTNGTFAAGSSSTWPASQAMERVGATETRFLNSSHGYIVEWGIYTNTFLSADNVCTLHYYATNTYAFSP